MRQLREQDKDKTDAATVTKENSTKSNVEDNLENTETADFVDQDNANLTEIEEKPQEDAMSTTEATTAPQSQPIVAKKKGVSSNAFASSSTTNSFNVLTDRPTSRVTNPPGGKDNLWF
jgi:hypothetical protein